MTIVVHLRNLSTLAGDLYQRGHSPSGAVLTPPRHVRLACQLKQFTREWQLEAII